MPKQTLILDSTQIQAFMDCPRIWEFSQVRRLTPKVFPPKDLMVMGTLGHKYLEIYYKELAKNVPFTTALEVAFSFDPEKETGAVFPLSQPNRIKVQNQVRLYAFKYFREGDFHVTDPNQVELGFSHPLYEDDEFLFVLEGKIDIHNALQKNGTRLGFVDHKFQGRRKDLYKKRIQFKNYAMVTNTDMAMVNYIRFTDHIKDDTFNRIFIPFNKMQHEAWKHRLIALYKQIAAAVRDGSTIENYWYTMASNPNWGSCEGKYGYPCEFGDVCEEYQPALIQLKLDNNFEKREPWSPW